MQHVFIIGSRGLPAKYGGFETFVEELVKRQISDQICYHVACLSDDLHQTHFSFKGVDCFTIKAPKLGPARVIAYDMMAIRYGLSLVKKEQMTRPIFYLLGNTIGGFIAPFAHQIRAAGGIVLVNPDGLEWKRAKWSRPVQAYLKYAERVMSKEADLLVADNAGIADYLKASYPWTKTRTIAYGTETRASSLTRTSPVVRAFFDQWQSREGDYYLIVGRFVPENNYATMLRAFMASQTQRDLLIICNHEGSAYLEQLRAQTGFDQDRRIKFVGTIYDRDLLTYIRQAAFAYLHGHEVGGTNPGLLEALSQTDLNLVLGVDFNQKVTLDTALYWDKSDNSLTELINQVDTQTDFSDLGRRAKAHMAETYNWDKIVREYEELFLDDR